MIYNARDYARLQSAVLGISLIGWLLMLTGLRAASCCAARSSAGSLETVLAADSAGALAMGWALMLVAMMAPMLVPPIYHLRISSFARRQARSVAWFVAGYGAIWMAAGAVMLAVEVAAARWAPQSYLPALLVALTALVWQASPFKQRCLNRCHSHPALPAFGLAADWGALRMGLVHGLWCVGSCWAAMLFPMLLPQGQIAAMALVAVLMFCERLDPPRAPAWRWRGFGTALRFLSLRLRGPRGTPAPLTLGVQG